MQFTKCFHIKNLTGSSSNKPVRYMDKFSRWESSSARLCGLPRVTQSVHYKMKPRTQLIFPTLSITTEYSMYSKWACSNLRYFISEAHVLLIRHLHKAQNSANFNNVYIQLLLNRISIHSVPFRKPMEGINARNTCSVLIPSHFLLAPVSAPTGTKHFNSWQKWEPRDNTLRHCKWSPNWNVVRK